MFEYAPYEPADNLRDFLKRNRPERRPVQDSLPVTAETQTQTTQCQTTAADEKQNVVELPPAKTEALTDADATADWSSLSLSEHTASSRVTQYAAIVGAASLNSTAADSTDSVFVPSVSS